MRLRAAAVSFALLFGAAGAFAAGRVVERPDLKRIFDAHGTNGTLVVRERGSGERIVYAPERAEKRFSPASTFKIVNFVVALDTGVVRPDTVIKWDRVAREYPAWNKAHDLRTAFRDSVVWYYQELARRIGRKAMEKHLKKFRYGNMKMGPAVDAFWLDGSLAVSAEEQARFLESLYFDARALGLRADHLDALKQAMLLESRPGWRLYGKTGVATASAPPYVGWLVGFVEKGDKVYFYAMNLDGAQVDAGFLSKRLAVVKDALHALGITADP